MQPTLVARGSFAVGLAVGAVSIVAITAALVPFRDHITPATPALLLIVPSVVTGIIGGRRAAVPTAVGAALAFNLAFLTPYGTLKVDVADDVIALACFVVVAIITGVLAASEGDRRRAAEQRAQEMERLYHRLETQQREREAIEEELNRLAVLDQVDEQRRALLRSVSHDLRTPLATIRAVSSDLRAGTQYDEATRVELLDLVSDEAERLDRLVANLLNLSRIEAGALTPDRQAIAVEELVSATVARLQRLLRDVRLVVSVPDDLPLVDADYTQIDQVITNLLENAVRHSPPRSTVELAARAVGDHIEISVSDEGTGVYQFERSRIFEPFQRGDGANGQGSGIGLAICKAVVTAHGGTIEVRSPPGAGARFVFTLPIRSDA